MVSSKSSTGRRGSRASGFGRGSRGSMGSDRGKGTIGKVPIVPWTPDPRKRLAGLSQQAAEPREGLGGVRPPDGPLVATLALQVLVRHAEATQRGGEAAVLVAVLVGATDLEADGGKGRARPAEPAGRALGRVPPPGRGIGAPARAG